MTTPPAPEALSRAQNSPWVIYALVFFLVVSTLVKALPQLQQLLGPIGKLLGGRAEEAKRAAMEADDELDRMKAAQVTELLEKVATLEERLNEQDERKHQHTLWDVQVQIALAKAGIEIAPPPPL